MEIVSIWHCIHWTITDCYGQIIHWVIIQRLPLTLPRWVIIKDPMHICTLPAYTHMAGPWFHAKDVEHGGRDTPQSQKCPWPSGKIKDTSWNTAKFWNCNKWSKYLYFMPECSSEYSISKRPILWQKQCLFQLTQFIMYVQLMWISYWCIHVITASSKTRTSQSISSGSCQEYGMHSWLHWGHTAVCKASTAKDSNWGHTATAGENNKLYHPVYFSSQTRWTASFGCIQLSYKVCFTESTMHALYSSSNQDQIENLTSQFEAFKQQFDRGISVQSAMTVEAMLNALSNLI